MSAEEAEDLLFFDQLFLTSFLRSLRLILGLDQPRSAASPRVEGEESGAGAARPNKRNQCRRLEATASLDSLLSLASFLRALRPIFNLAQQQNAAQPAHLAHDPRLA